ncbi:MAG TPA: hypothetical protein VG328_00180 [Stellaceae bacterium]|nr:hypothetical protein [Stellaceae bacterium]
MSKYDPLRDYLQNQRFKEIVVTFADIEAILGSSLPKSAERPQWWANIVGESSHVQREAWRDAGFDAFLIAGSNKVRFTRNR